VEVKGHIMDPCPDIFFVQGLEEFIPTTPEML